MIRLPELTHPQWTAAMDAARAYANGDVHSAVDRAEYRNARSLLADLLPADADVDRVIRAAIRWNTLDVLAAWLVMEIAR